MRNEPDGQMLAGDPLWYQDAIIYELHVRSFFDSNADGFGDFPGLIQKLDYLKDLGVTALWLLPFYPSPLRDDGYDIADYTDVNRIYGKLSDVRLLVKEAHRRGLRVITELVCNHTSTEERRARLLRLVRDQQEVRGRPGHIQRLRGLQLDLGPHCRRLLLAPLLQSPARPQFR